MEVCNTPVNPLKKKKKKKMQKIYVTSASLNAPPPAFPLHFLPNIHRGSFRAQSKMADRPVPIAQQRLMDVKLGQLPSWLGTRDFTPNGLVGSVRRGYERYYNKYINVKKGGFGGIAMILAGYVVLSYVWEYDHIKHDRWRKYH
ncbi:hypothetical protein PDJAM_G00141650 [Pangasius djambal]|uniref:Uncharacterized protein n=1 Tax=Pangasius djambal TaxID=1691987 RepID=A0ACC5ZH01_9TELE|nr:hypothetical protein [Pangasius djambal]